MKNTHKLSFKTTLPCLKKNFFEKSFEIINPASGRGAIFCYPNNINTPS